MIAGVQQLLYVNHMFLKYADVSSTYFLDLSKTPYIIVVNLRVILFKGMVSYFSDVYNSWSRALCDNCTTKFMATKIQSEVPSATLL